MVEAVATSVGDYLRSVAKERWLCSEELFTILCSEPNSIGLCLSPSEDYYPSGNAYY